MRIRELETVPASHVVPSDRELKLELTREELQRLDAHPRLVDLAVGRPATRTVRSIFFDTPDQKLRQAGISLSLCSDGDGWVQTVACDAARNGASAASATAAATDRPEPDLAAIDSAKLRREVTRLTHGSVLEPAFETVVKRTTRQLHTERGDLELALDEGVIRAGNAERPVCEAELELRSGTADALLETAAALFAEMPLRLAQATNADRGYGLLVSRSGAGPWPERARPLVLAPDATCRDALRGLTHLAAQQISVNRRVTLETDDPEGPHQLRIALRRLRSAIRAFRPLIDTPSTRAMDQHARAVARAVGELRDADVFLDSIYAQAAGIIKGHGGLQPLKEALVKHRARTREQARAALQGSHWSALELYLSLWPRTLGDCAELDRPAVDFAGEALETCWRKVAKKGRHLARLTDEERHALRRRLKRLRYAVEFLSSLYEPGRVRPFLKRLKQLQDVLGYVNDVATARRLEGIAEEFGRDSRECQRAVGYVLGWHGARAAASWEGAQARWDELRKIGRFWR